MEGASRIGLREARSVSELQHNLKGSVERLKEKKTPLVLTVNGRAKLIVQECRKRYSTDWSVPRL